MMTVKRETIWTIGHSTRPIEEFTGLLTANGIEQLVDIRAYPGSRRYPHFNRENLIQSMGAANIHYVHIETLGGRRKPQPDSTNDAWHHPAFRGYADYMQSPAFVEAVSELERIAGEARSAYMCSEAPWWKCHRALVSDYLKARGWIVLHIMGPGKVVEHPYTAPARATQGRLFYDASDS